MSSIDQMQQGLEKALQAASQADDRELAGKVRDEGRRLVFILHGLLRTSRLHDKDNAAFEAPSKEFSSTLQGLLDLLGAVHIVCVEDQIYVNDIRLRGNPREQLVIESFVQEFSRHNVGGISFHGPMKPEGVRTFAQQVAQPRFDVEQPRTALELRLTSVGDIALTGTHRFRIGGEPTQQQKDYSDAMKRGASVVAEAVQNLAADRIPNPLPVRRAVIDMVNSIREKPDAGTTEPFKKTAGCAGEQHLLSVTSLTLTLGEAVGLPEGALSDLGVAAMLHDIGYTKVPDHSGHCAAGARQLMRQRGFHEAKIRRLLLVLEHHDPYADPDKGGTPTPETMPSLFARILRITNDYDLLIATRPGQPPPLSPALALSHMWAARGTLYDPHLLALFVQLLGRFPPGTLLELSDGRWALSVSGARDKQHFSWPLVRIVRGSDGTSRDAREEIDLFEVRTQIQPARILDPSSKGVEVGSVFGAGPPAGASEMPAAPTDQEPTGGQEPAGNA